MRWPVVARVAVAAVGLSCAVAIFVYTRKRPPPPRPATSLSNVDPTSASTAGEGVTIFLRKGKSPITLSAQGSRTYDDGSTQLDKVKIEGLEDTRFIITCDVLKTMGKSLAEGGPVRYDCSGHVVLVTDDGLRLESETASYDNVTSLLTIPGPVTFSKGRLSGAGVGAAYDRELDTFTILDQASAHVQPDVMGKGGADATAKQMGLVRGQHLLLLAGNARIVGEAQTLTSDHATVGFTEDESAIKYLELRGTGRVTPHPGAAADRPGLSADNITMTFRPDGLTLQHATLTGRAVLTLSGAASRTISASWIDIVTGTDGSTLTGLRARDGVVVSLPATATAAGRRITAASLNAAGEDGKGLTSARFDGNPRFEERAPVGPRVGGPPPATAPDRAGSATILVLALGGQFDAIERAEFQQRAEFRDGPMTGLADVAEYHAAKGELKLMPNLREPRRRSSVTAPDLWVEGNTIDMEIGTQNLLARGNVRTRATTTAKPVAEGTLFGGTTPIHGLAETFQYRKEGGLGTYVGSARAQATLRQGETQVTANRIMFTETSRDLEAEGKVDSTWQLADADSAALKTYSVRAETFKYVEARRHAIYTGLPVTLETAEGDTIESHRLTLQLAAASRTLTSLHAERMDGKYVFAKLTGGYEGLGDDLVYRAVDETYTLRGTSALAKAPDTRSGTSPAGSRDCSVQESLVFEFNRRTGEWKLPGGGEAPRSAIKISCSVDLRHYKK